jgi:hypothetical protein
MSKEKLIEMVARQAEIVINRYVRATDAFFANIPAKDEKKYSEKATKLDEIIQGSFGMYEGKVREMMSEVIGEELPPVKKSEAVRFDKYVLVVPLEDKIGHRYELGKVCYPAFAYAGNSITSYRDPGAFRKPTKEEIDEFVLLNIARLVNH